MTAITTTGPARARRRHSLTGGVSVAALMAVSPAFAQSAAPIPNKPARAAQLEVVVVTAQKRTQRLQDVPIAVTAITQATLQANRITSTTDLDGVAPNVTVREAAGSVGIPAFAIRGIVSYGVVPGSDKEASIYIDGVYIGSPTASNFELPDIQRIEVLRGPQGTLFGRNATTGAISVVTRDPTGQLGGRQEFTVGNYNQFRTRTSIDLPAVGPFSAYFSYVHNQRDGDTKNLGAGQVWDRTGPNTKQGIAVSPSRLGDHDGNTYFVAVKYQPNDIFKTIYKFDYAEDDFTPDAIASVALNPAGLGPAGGGFLNGVLASNPGAYVLDPSGRRPAAVNNAFTVPGYEKTYGHSLTSTLQVNDAISIKNIGAYRYSFVYGDTQLDGLGGLTLPAAFGGGPNVPFDLLAINSQTENRQWSDELQVNYASHFLALTSGLLYFHQDTTSGAPFGLSNNFALASFPDGRIPLGITPNTPGGEGTSYNRATSLAAYSQAEFHVTKQVDVVGGVRVTEDRKSGTYNYGGIFTPGPGGNYATGTFSDVQYANFIYQKTKPAWSLGVNYKPTRDTLLYGKYSDSFVSGGAIGTFSFVPETASSFEVGGKADFLNHRLRANVALFDVEYRNLQSAQGGTNVPGAAALGTLIVDQGNANAKGAELELNARPIDPITLGASLGYTDVYYTALTDLIKQSFQGSYVPTLIPKWTASLSGQYESEPMWRGATFVARIDTNWHSKENVLQRDVANVPGFSALAFIPATWMVNTRVALANINVGGHTMEIAGWAKNLTNTRVPSFPLTFATFAASTTFVQARTYGLDLSFQF